MNNDRKVKTILVSSLQIVGVIKSDGKYNVFFKDHSNLIMTYAEIKRFVDQEFN